MRFSKVGYENHTKYVYLMFTVYVHGHRPIAVNVKKFIVINISHNLFEERADMANSALLFCLMSFTDSKCDYGKFYATMFHGGETVCSNFADKIISY